MTENPQPTQAIEPKRPKLIKSRRSCIGCGLRPGLLYSNGLCDPCQYGDRA